MSMKVWGVTFVVYLVSGHVLNVTLTQEAASGTELRQQLKKDVLERFSYEDGEVPLMLGDTAFMPGSVLAVTIGEIFPWGDLT